MYRKEINKYIEKSASSWLLTRIILEFLWHEYVSKLVKAQFITNCNYMRNCHLNCALCHSDVIDGVYHDRK
jgi:hypothetical protein